MKTGFKKLIFLAIPVFVLITVYQNCGQSAPSSSGADSSQSTPTPTPTPTPTTPLPTPSPVSGMQNTWKSINMTNAPTPRSSHTAVWSGTEMLVWGGSFTNTGGRYNPTTDSWASMSTSGAPSARSYHRAVWTGSKMVVWGGVTSVSGSTITTTNTGGVYDPATDTWTAMSTTGAPSARWYFLMAWTGSKVLVWGGNADSSNPAPGGALYDPATNTWSAMPTAGAPSMTPFSRAAVVGNSLVVFGGDQGITGGVYDFASNSWKSMNLNGAPSSRYFPFAASTGSKAVFFGGMTTSGGSETIFNTGGVYDVASNSWHLMSTTGAPTLDEDVSNVGIWTGSLFIAWGGQTVSGGSIVRTNAGGFYDPASDVWTPISLSGAPAGRVAYTTVWTGTNMIVYGGIDANNYLLNNGFILQ